MRRANTRDLRGFFGLAGRAAGVDAGHLVAVAHALATGHAGFGRRAPAGTREQVVATKGDQQCARGDQSGGGHPSLLSAKRVPSASGLSRVAPPPGRPTRSCRRGPRSSTDRRTPRAWAAALIARAWA